MVCNPNSVPDNKAFSFSNSPIDSYRNTGICRCALIARDSEIEDLKQCFESEESEFVIVYGRRRIGKTFLIEEFFDKTYDFKFVGGHKLTTEQQLRNFSLALKRYSKGSLQKFADWSEAFYALGDYIETIDEDRKKVIFIDEMPWIDTPDSESEVTTS